MKRSLVRVASWRWRARVIRWKTTTAAAREPAAAGSRASDRQGRRRGRGERRVGRREASGGVAGSMPGLGGAARHHADVGRDGRAAGAGWRDRRDRRGRGRDRRRGQRRDRRVAASGGTAAWRAVGPAGRSPGWPARSAGCSGAVVRSVPCVKQVGQPCVVSAECATAQCADGVCCDSACLGACRSFNLAASVGRCSRWRQARRIRTVRCVATVARDVRAGWDDATDRADCRKYAIGSICAAETCSGDVFTPPSVCNGAGTCVRPAPSSCLRPSSAAAQAPLSFCTADRSARLACARTVRASVRSGVPCRDDDECASGLCAAGRLLRDAPARARASRCGLAGTVRRSAAASPTRTRP